MTWQPELDDLRRREAFARRWEALTRSGAARPGWLTVRDRIDKIVDQKSFHEIGAISGIADMARTTSSST
jgi:acetyl-CoA carboxylase carboxyltransferase component